MLILSMLSYHTPWHEKVIQTMMNEKHELELTMMKKVSLSLKNEFDILSRYLLFHFMPRPYTVLVRTNTAFINEL